MTEALPRFMYRGAFVSWRYFVRQLTGLDSEHGEIVLCNDGRYHYRAELPEGVQAIEGGLWYGPE